MPNRIVQKYIERPLLLFSGRKFDIRQWVLVRSVSPLRVFLFSECYLRLCNEMYDLGDLRNRERHISNWQINKNGKHVVDGAVASLSDFKDELHEITGSRCFWEDELLPQLNDIVVRTLRAVETKLVPRQDSFELYGFDLMVDERMKMWLLEVNLSPGCEGRTPHLDRMLTRMSKRLVEIAVLGQEDPDGEQPDWMNICDDSADSSMSHLVEATQRAPGDLPCTADLTVHGRQLRVPRKARRLPASCEEQSAVAPIPDVERDESLAAVSSHLCETSVAPSPPRELDQISASAKIGVHEPSAAAILNEQEQISPSKTSDAGATSAATTQESEQAETSRTISGDLCEANVASLQEIKHDEVSTTAMNDSYEASSSSLPNNQDDYSDQFDYNQDNYNEDDYNEDDNNVDDYSEASAAVLQEIEHYENSAAMSSDSFEASAVPMANDEEDEIAVAESGAWEASEEGEDAALVMSSKAGELSIETCAGAVLRSGTTSTSPSPRAADEASSDFEDDWEGESDCSSNDDADP